jgi:fatty-acyl-CoA synthase
MSRHKVPSYVLFTSELPMNAAGKIQKYKLRERAAEQVEKIIKENAV